MHRIFAQISDEQQPYLSQRESLKVLKNTIHENQSSFRLTLVISTFVPSGASPFLEHLFFPIVVASDSAWL